MNSSTSASEASAGLAAAELRQWRRFLRRLALVAVGLPVALILVAVALDPFDTGFGLVRVQGTFAKGPRLGDASRIHDGSFDAAILGNSHIMSLSPARLSRLTGYRFVMLGVPGTGVPEQMILLDAYLARHAPPRVLVFGLDALVCQADPRALPPTPFPDWLYDRNRLIYAAGLFRWRLLEDLGRRLGLIAGLIPPVPRDGTFDLYEGETPDAAVSAARIAATPPEDLTLPAGATRVGLDLLRAHLDAVPRATQIVFLWPPVATQILPRPGTAAADALAGCKRAVADLAHAHPGSLVIDWHGPRPGTADPANFRDATHIYAPLAEAVEADIAGALRSAAGSSGGGHP